MRHHLFCRASNHDPTPCSHQILPSLPHWITKNAHGHFNAKEKLYYHCAFAASANSSLRVKRAALACKRLRFLVSFLICSRIRRRRSINSAWVCRNSARRALCIASAGADVSLRSIWKRAKPTKQRARANEPMQISQKLNSLSAQQ